MTRTMFPMACVFFAACSSATDPAPDRALPTGVYAYQSVAGTGTLRISYSAPDSIAGEWNVPGMTGPTQLGGWNQTAFVLYGTKRDRVALSAGGPDSVTITTVYAHRVTRTSCTVQIPLSGEPVRACTLTRMGN